jgi:uncharacterized protein
VAARMLGIPALTMYDYEHTETRIFNTFSDLVLVPEMIPDDILDSIGLKAEKRQKYPGLKEELYLRYFSPDPEYRKKFIADHGIDVPDGAILAVLRPPATTANYHSPESETVLRGVMQRLLAAGNVFTVIVPRTAEQAAEIEEMARTLGDNQRCHVLRRAVDGLALAAAADLLISGGGTMNREAALLGVPVYSIFAGRTGALDRAMESDGRIVRVLTPDAVEKIRLERRRAARAPVITDAVEAFVLSRINSYLETV